MKPGTKLLIAVATGVALAGGAHSSQFQHLTATLTAAQGPAANEALGQHMAAAAGWTGREWSCLNWLWTRESGWRLVWNTEGSGAYGIPQAQPPSKMAAAGPDYMTNPATEIRWGLGYIRGTYGTPCSAWSHEEEAGWY